MIFRNLIFEPEVVKQRLRAGMVSHHKQQASKCNGEQQHRVLWPAYNLNIAPPQASIEGLFQQTRLFSTVRDRIEKRRSGSGQLQHRDLRAGTEPDGEASYANAAVHVELLATVFVQAPD